MYGPFTFTSGSQDKDPDIYFIQFYIHVFTDIYTSSNCLNTQREYVRIMVIMYKRRQKDLSCVYM